MKYADSVKDYGYITAAVDSYQNNAAGVKWSDRANMKTQGVPTSALQPSNILDESFKVNFY